MQSIIDSLNFRELGPFNSREIALAVCIIFALLFCLRSAGIRESFKSVIKAFFAKKLIVLYLITIAYCIIPLALFYHFGFWRIALVKDATFWLLFSALPTLMTVNKADEHYFKKLLYNNVKFTIVIEFIVGLHTFHIFTEIIMVVAAIFIGGMMAVSEKKPEHKAVNMIFTRLAQIVGIIIFSTAVYSFVVDIKKFMTLDKFEEFSLPIVLGIWIVPLLYILNVYMTYENVYISVTHAIRDPELCRFAKRQALLHFKFDTESLKRWRQSLHITEINKKQDILISFLDLERLKLIESDPPGVDISKGWSPYQAKSFLEDEGIMTNHYKRCYDNEWQAISDCVKLGEEIIGNDISYHVTGDQSVATCLKLMVNINSIDKENLAIDKFISCAKSLTEAALKEPMPSDMAAAILRQEDFIKKFKNKRLLVSKFEHLNRRQAYTLTYTIEQL